MKFAGCIQARLASTRLPKKVLKPLGGKTMLECIASQLFASKVSQVVISTSSSAEDDALAEFAKTQHWKVNRDSVDDIVSRLNGSLQLTDADALVRVWGDCPFICPDIIDAMIKVMQEKQLDFIHNSDIAKRSFPPGLDIEIYRRALLEKMDQQISDRKQREFPVEFVKNNSLLKYHLFSTDTDNSHIHLTVDYQEDLLAAEKLYQQLSLSRQIPFHYDQLMEAIARTGIDREFSSSPRNIEYKEYLKTSKGFST